MNDTLLKVGSWRSVVVSSLVVLGLAGCGQPASLVDAGVDAGPEPVPDAGPPLPAVGLTLLDVERGVDLTPDGRAALLWKQSTGELYRYDTVTGQTALKANLDPVQLQAQQPHAISADFQIAAGYGFQPGEAGVWAEGTGWNKLGTPMAEGCVDHSGPTPIVDELGAAFDISADGTTVVGLLWDGCLASRAFKWSAGTGTFTVLPKAGSTGYERATVVSADGKVAAGFAPLEGSSSSVDRSPAMWREDGTGVMLEPSNFTAPGEVKAISADGQTLAGDWASELGGSTGFTWTAATGVVRFNSGSATPERDTIYVNAMSANGKVIVGAVSSFDPDLLESTQRAFIWSQGKGVQSLADAAKAAQVTVPAGVTLGNVMAISADGTVILGTATLPADPQDPLGQPIDRLFVLVLPASALP